MISSRTDFAFRIPVGNGDDCVQKESIVAVQQASVKTWASTTLHCTHSAFASGTSGDADSVYPRI